MPSLKNELWLASRDRLVQATVLVAFVLSAVAVIVGLNTSHQQRMLIERVDAAVAEDRAYVLAQQSDPGGAAYYAYHFTYDPPSPLAFAAQGTRGSLPWKHRVRMLALEGQIYEADTGNPELAMGGRLDFAFVVAVLVPIFLIVLLYDGQAGERRGRRFELLVATDQQGGLFALRAILRAGLLFAAVGAPFLLGAVISGAGLGGTLTVLGALGLNVVFWAVCCAFVALRLSSGPTVAATLIGLWLTLALAVPTAGKLLVEGTIPVPVGGELLLTQREAVNDAWDLPKEATMKPFVEHHPEWAPYADISLGFEWKWYYAFQQVGDQTVEDQSKALREGIAARDRMMGTVALLSPTLLSERLISQAAETDVAAYQAYERCVRDFHRELRMFHYPMLFETKPFSQEAMAELPSFTPCTQ
ncbi:MAG: DUF3526 domain-containing protein [Pseudomonadota bacterium]